MGICQSRPAVANRGADPAASAATSRVGGMTVNGSTTGTSARWTNKRSGLLRRRNSESSVVTIIPEATEEDVWDDHDSLTEGGLVYNNGGDKGQKLSVHRQPPNLSSSSPSSGLLTPSTTTETLTHVTAPSVGSSPPDDDDMDTFNDDDDVSSSSSTGSDPNNRNNTGVGTNNSIASFTPYSLVSPLATKTTKTGIVVGATTSDNDNNMCLIEDDDSTAMVIEEEDEDPCAPSDESDVENNNNNTDKDVEDELEPGRLICGSNNNDNNSQAKPTKSTGLSFKLLPSRFKKKNSNNKMPSSSRAVFSGSSTSSASPSPPNSSEKKAGATTGAPAPSAVDPRTMSHFHRLELQAKLAKQAQVKQQKQRKYQDRSQDVQGYKQLWKEYQQLVLLEQQLEHQQQNHENGTTEELNLTSPVGTTESEGQVDHAIVPALEPARRGRSSKSTSGRNHHRRRAQSFDLHDSSNWYFDFQAVDFAYEGFEHDPHQLQTSLSLLSESSMEIQKRLYAEKRRFRKLHKKLKKRQNKGKRNAPPSSSSYTPNNHSTYDESANTPVSNLLSAMEMTTPQAVVPRRDYGPSRRSATGGGGVSGASSVHSAPVVGSYFQHHQQYDVNVDTTPSEWVDHEIQCYGDANSSCMSDMGDTASYTSNDYRVSRRSNRSYYSSMTGTTNGVRVSSHHDKLAELEAKVQALQERNAELNNSVAVAVEESTATTSSTPSSPNMGSTNAAATAASSPTSDPAASASDSAKTPVATNRVASLRQIFEANHTEVTSIHPSALWHASSESDALEDDERHAPPRIALQYLQQQQHQHRVVADESSEDLGPDVSILSAIEESMTSFASSPDRSVMESVNPDDAAPQPPSPLLLQQQSSPTKPENDLGEDEAILGSLNNSPTSGKRLEATLNLEVSPTRTGPPCTSEEERITLLLVPNESIDVPPQEEHPPPPRVGKPIPAKTTTEPSTSPVETATSCEMPSLVGLETLSSTATASEDGEYDDPVSEEKKEDDSDDGRDTSPAKSSQTDLDSSALPEEVDIFDKLAQGDFDEDESELIQEASPEKPCKPDPPGKAMLNGTPSLELKRRPWAIDSPVKSRFTALGAHKSHSDPTPTATPARSPFSSPLKSRSPQKNRWIAELSTREFLAMSEENALERLARIERREAQRANPTLYNRSEHGAELDAPLDEADVATIVEDRQSELHALVNEGCDEIVILGDSELGENLLDETAVATEGTAHSEKSTDNLATASQLVAVPQDGIKLRESPSDSGECSASLKIITIGDDATASGKDAAVMLNEKASDAAAEAMGNSSARVFLTKESHESVETGKPLAQFDAADVSLESEGLQEGYTSANVIEPFHVNMEFLARTVSVIDGEAPDDEIPDAYHHEGFAAPMDEISAESVELGASKLNAFVESDTLHSAIAAKLATVDSELPRDVTLVETEPKDTPNGLDVNEVADESSFQSPLSMMEQEVSPSAKDSQEDANLSMAPQEPLSFSSLEVPENAVEVSKPTEREAANTSSIENTFNDKQCAVTPDTVPIDSIASEVPLAKDPIELTLAYSSSTVSYSLEHGAVIDETAVDASCAEAAQTSDQVSPVAEAPPCKSASVSPVETAAVGSLVFENPDAVKVYSMAPRDVTNVEPTSPACMDSEGDEPKQGTDLEETLVVEQVEVTKDDVIVTSAPLAVDGAFVVSSAVNRERPSSSWLGSATSSLELADTIEKEVQQVLARYRGWSVDGTAESTHEQEGVDVVDDEDDAPEDERRATALAKQSQQLQSSPLQE